MLPIQNELRQLADPTKIPQSLRFFKCQPNQYGYGDKFLGGITASQILTLSQTYQTLPLTKIKQLLHSPYHEERACALKILVIQYQKQLRPRKRIVKFYLQNKKYINNWDLVDASAYKILGDYCLTNSQNNLITNLSDSHRHWDRRIAIVSTLIFIQHHHFSLTLNLVTKFLNDPEDLMHKACGWMLREISKRDLKILKKFIKQYGPQIPRTTLRYAIERFNPRLRKQILKSTKK